MNNRIEKFLLRAHKISLRLVVIPVFKSFFSLLMQLNVRGKNKKERLGGLFKGLAKGVDEVLLSGQKVKVAD